MSHLSRFFHFHDGEPSHRAVKMLASLVGAIMLALTSTAVTAIQAMEESDRAPIELRFVGGCPKVDAPADAPTIALIDDHADIVWYTTADADVNEIAFTIAEGEPRRIPATGGRAHRASIADLVPGATYYFRVSSRTTRSNAVVQSGTCTFTAPGDDRSAPEILRAAIENVGTTTATVVFTTMEPARGSVRVRTDAAPDTTTASDAADDQLTTMHAFALTDLAPGQTYTGSASATDEVGNTATTDLPLFTTLRDIAADGESPVIDAFECRIVPRGILVTFTVPEIAVFGNIAYGLDTNDRDEAARTNRTLEAAPTMNALTGTTAFARTLTDFESNVPYTIIASATDAAGNTTYSPSISCMNVGP